MNHKEMEERDEEKEDEREKEGMTEQQESVFRSYGISEEEITRMKKEGLNYQEQSFVDTAVIMLDYLEERYGETFEVVGGDIPNILSDGYWITARACEGEHVGEEFVVKYLGEAGCRDGYASILKKAEACKVFESFIHEAFNDITAFATVIGEYGNEISLDMTGEELLSEMLFQFDLIFTAPDMNDEDFSQRVAEIETYVKDSGINSEGFIFCFYDEIDPDLTIDEEQYLIAYSDTLAYKWRELIVTRNYGG